MQYTEVEQKYTLIDPAAARKCLAAHGAEKLRDSKQVDTYYNAPHRDFLMSEYISEWLRLRSDNRSTSVNYKRWLPTDAEIKTHCDEYETGVVDGEALRRLLMALGFHEIVVVDKMREEWGFANSVLIAINSVVGLGDFMEFEYKGTAESVEEAHEVIGRAIKELGVELGERDYRGYPYHLLGRQA